METATTTGPLTAAGLARALTFVAIIVYGLAALRPHAAIDWLTDRIADVGYAR